MRRAVTLLTTTRGRRWAAFEDPLEVHRARELSEVVSLLRRVEEATHAGRWVVLVLAYDAGPALEPAMDALRHPTAPLAVAGVFRGPAEVAGPRLAEHRVGAAEPSWGEAEHHRAVRSLLDHIGRGDVYQANLTLRLRAPFEG